MRIHCLGVGSIGSLFATNLAQLSNPPKVRLILRRKNLAKSLLTAQDSGWTSHFPPSVSPGPHISLTVERDALARRTDGFEVEATATPADRAEQSRVLSDGSGGGSAKAVRSSTFGDLVRNDPISTLIITTKSPQTIPSLRPLLPRLSSKSTIVLCQNGMGVLEGLLDHYWPDDVEGAGGLYGAGGRPSFICATTTHGVWRKDHNHFVHAGVGDVKFGVVPNRAVLSSLANLPSPSWGDAYNNPLLNARSLALPTLEHLPLTPDTVSLHQTVSALLQSELRASWLPLPTLQIAQLQKLAVNTSVNCLTGILGVNNGSLVGSGKAKRIIRSVSNECALVFSAHIAREEGRWEPPVLYSDSEDDDAASLSSFPSSLPLNSSSHPPPPPLPESHPLSASSLADYTIRVCMATSNNLSSTLQDLLAVTPTQPHRPSQTEIDYINGYVVALGRRYGLPTPVTDTLGNVVQLKEQLVRAGAVDRVVETRLKSERRKQLTERERDPVFLQTRKEQGESRRKEFERAEEHREQRSGRFERDRRRSLEQRRRHSS
ncbi:ketopantoate reductase PanE/ApbA C terminal-domain-containing protein [Leucosporidium creatinivorum]|uniref:Ketopantoate reductase PanE/ApbA C terminal-domain-containing protein n=1 Tax=Leucosporidium creatinivorum TaxID=106004 RepID=A0A1Y2G260_9BASI|nr:ketopantoate reductase PanE/ApbA C terminal-domain-containing protein [Leucosporidium creatinivorum]